ncbi:hypothetical protein KY290_003157 [Solanum tuberosum]|uniref:Uncharacterized protein n=1 Tax=Solanum tuberosum TaxID=4113 RepID=A0ABQ7WS53_SOLTU|nr:hypothetical protein KY290_003157 [Solanum tuberosum]
MMNCSIKDALVAEEYFFRSHPEVDPCEDLTDDDIRTKPWVPNLLYLCQKSHFKFTSEDGLHKYTSCGNKAHEMALQQVKPSRIAAPNLSVLDWEQVVRLAPVVEKTTASGSNVGSSWRISSIFEHGPCFLNDPLETGKSDQKRSTQCGSSRNFIGIGSGVFIFKRKPPRRDVATRFTKLSEKKFKILEELPLDAETVERHLVLIGG